MLRGSGCGLRSGAGGSSSSSIWDQGAINNDFGGIPAGTDLDGYTFDEITELAAMFQQPSFSAFNCTNFNQVQECGDEIGTTLNFSFTLTNQSYVVANSLKVVDVTSGSDLISDQSFSGGTVSFDLDAVVYKSTHNSSQAYRVEVTDSLGNTISRTFTFYWRMPMYYGKETATTLLAGEITSALTKALNSSANVNITWPDTTPDADYGYLVVHSSLNQPSGAVNTANDLTIAMVTTESDASYDTANEDDLDYYEVTISVGTDNPSSETFYVYRTLNGFAGAITADFDV